MSNPRVSDAELVALARSGEVAALGALLERYRPSLYATAIRVLRNRDDALDAVQEPCLAALARLGSIRDPEAVGAWLHTVVRNASLMLRRGADQERTPATAGIPVLACGPEDTLQEHALADWVWAALETLTPDDRLTVMLRHFSRCQEYAAIAAMTGVPIGTVRSRLNRARSRLSTALLASSEATGEGHALLEAGRRAEWRHFYSELHEAPMLRTYRERYKPDCEVSDTVGHWTGIESWSAHEREAITLGVRARVLDVWASSDLTVLEIDFVNPASAAGHCPPRSTFVHHLADGRSEQLDIYYV